MSNCVMTGSLCGVEAAPVQVEVSIVRGLPGFDLVGLPEAAIRESRVRVDAALRNSSFALPERRFAVNLAPADLRKSGASFDLAIAVALLRACELCAPNHLGDTLVLGELSLDGSLRPARGALAQLRSGRARGLRRALVPAADADWGALVPEMDVFGAASLREAVDFLNSEATLPTSAPYRPLGPDTGAPDLLEVRGQAQAKRALEIAAAGRHNLLMVGPPGTGKTMLARRLPPLLPAPEPDEALGIATVASVANLQGGPPTQLRRPFRAPHHSCSEAALIGGSVPIRPGEITLAHGGVLFLDELPEFRRNVLESLRPIMESGVSVVARARERAVLPADALLVAAMNPCPCGYAGDRRRVCRCTPDAVERYQGRVSGPLLDRFDLHVLLPPVQTRMLEGKAQGEDSAAVRARVSAAWERRRRRERELRQRGEARGDSQMAAELTQDARALLHRSMDRLRLSLRAYSKLLRVSRTIADLAGSLPVAAEHVAEAVQFRLLDRERSEPGGQLVTTGQALPATPANESPTTNQ